MSAHTPGPWRLGTNGDECAKDHAICSGPYVLAKVYGMGYPIGKGWSPESAANACLIAAAPSMLEALKAARDFIAFEGIGSMKEGLVADINSIIARAEGK